MSSAAAALLPAGITLGAARTKGEGYITLFPICHCSYLSPPHGTWAAALAAGTAGAGSDAEGRWSSGCSEAAAFRRRLGGSRSRAGISASASPGSCHQGRAAGHTVRVWPPMLGRGGGGGVCSPCPLQRPPGSIWVMQVPAQQALSQSCPGDTAALAPGVHWDLSSWESAARPSPSADSDLRATLLPFSPAQDHGAELRGWSGR